MRFRIVKNKVGEKGGFASLDFYNNSGFDTESALFDAAQDSEAIERAGSYYSFERPNGEEIREQGFDNFLEELKSHEEYDTIIKEIKDKIYDITKPVAEENTEEESEGSDESKDVPDKKPA